MLQIVCGLQYIMTKISLTTYQLFEYTFLAIGIHQKFPFVRKNFPSQYQMDYGTP